MHFSASKLILLYTDTVPVPPTPPLQLWIDGDGVLINDGDGQELEC